MNTPIQFDDPDVLAAQNSPRGMRRSTKVLLALGVLVVVGGSITAVDLALSHRDTSTRHFDEPIDHVDIETSGGSVRLVGTNDSTITVETNVRSGLRSPHHLENVVDGQLVIRSSCSHLPTHACSVDYVIHVPSDVSVELDGNGVDAQIESITGDLDVSINGGDVDASFSEAPNQIKARANGGDIDIVIPDDQDSYRVDASSNGGSTDVDVRSDPASARSIDLHTNGGTISVAYP